MRILSVRAASVFLFFACLTAAEKPSKEARIERLLALTNAGAIMNQMYDQIKALTASQLPPGTSPEERAKAVGIQNKVMDLVKTRMSWEKMRPEYVKIYSETFTEEEIDGMLAFYQSPAGRSMMQKMPALMAKSIAMAQAQMKDLIPEIQRITREAAAK
jgi:hypothetical protein